METNNQNHQQIMQQASRQMMQYITGKWISKPVYVVTKFRIADILAESPKTIIQLADQCQAKPDYLYRILRALASVGIFTELIEKGNQTFANTPMSECLMEGAMGPMAQMFLSGWHNAAWDKLPDSVKTGEIAFESAHGMPAFDWLEQHPRAAADYHQAQAAKAAQTHSIIANVYDFTKTKTITDIGGGYGSLMISLLKVNPHMQGIVADSPVVISKAQELIKSAGMFEQCQAISCDFFKEVPGGSDAYILSHILHDWEDDQALVILKNCFEAMNKNSKLLIVEMVIPDGNDFSVSKLLDLEVLVMGGGKERTEAEFRTLFNKAGFSLNRIIPTPSDIFVIECQKVI